mmetsp:Transcript_97428/g.172553  ORF Transcript_97428/g.172553 Transcript_97428/m.172553 type:complete len:146 (+) Transcript_97428:104-541(+)
MFKREEYVENPLHTAACNGDTDLLRELLAAGHDPNLPNFRETPPLHMAVEAGVLDAVRVLLEHGADVNCVHGARGTTAAHVAAGSGLAEVLQLLLEAGADVDARNSWGDNVVKVAKKQKKSSKPGSEEVMAVLIATGHVAPPAAG